MSRPMRTTRLRLRSSPAHVHAGASTCAASSLAATLWSLAVEGERRPSRDRALGHVGRRTAAARGSLGEGGLVRLRRALTAATRRSRARAAGRPPSPSANFDAVEAKDPRLRRRLREEAARSMSVVVGLRNEPGDVPADGRRLVSAPRSSWPADVDRVADALRPSVIATSCGRTSSAARRSPCRRRSRSRRVSCAERRSRRPPLSAGG